MPHVGCLQCPHVLRCLPRVASPIPQVQGLQSEYTRMVDSGGAASAPSGPAAGKAGAAGAAGLSADEVATLRKLVADLEEQNSKLQVGPG